MRTTTALVSMISLVLGAAVLPTTGCDDVEPKEADDDDAPGDDDDGDDDDDDDDDDDGGGGDSEVIDDLEDGDGGITVTSGRIGYWYTYNDNEESGDCEQAPEAGGEFMPETGGPEGSVYAAHTTGSGCTMWGAGMGFDLNNPGEGDDDDDDGGRGVALPSPYDASDYKGVRFKYKSVTPFRFKFPIEAIIPATQGGTCDPDAKCSDAHGSAVGASEDWTEFEVKFDKLSQEGWGEMAGFDASTAMQIQFQTPSDVEFDLWVDDISFF